MERKSNMRRPCIVGSRWGSILPLFTFILGLLILSACTPTSIAVSKKASLAASQKASIPVSKKTPIPVAKTAPARCQPGHTVGFLSTSHSELVDASGCQVSLTGVNWFGFETSTFAPHGLGVRNWQDMLKQIARTGFNTIRLPFTNQLFDPGSQPQGINYQLNPDLKGLQGLALMDRIIQGARKPGLRVILDRHDPTPYLRPPFCYTTHLPTTPCSQSRTL